MANKISQAEARRLRRRVSRLEQILFDQRAYWKNDWPGGVHLDTISINETEQAIIRTARKLQYAVVVTQVNDKQIELYACEVDKG